MGAAPPGLFCKMSAQGQTDAVTFFAAAKLHPNRWIWGDKDAFRLTWLATGTPFYMSTDFPMRLTPHFPNRNNRATLLLQQIDGVPYFAHQWKAPHLAGWGEPASITIMHNSSGRDHGSYCAHGSPSSAADDNEEMFVGVPKRKR